MPQVLEMMILTTMQLNGYSYYSLLANPAQLGSLASRGWASYLIRTSNLASKESATPGASVFRRW